VKEILAASGYTTVNTLGSGFNSPTGVAVDGNGNVFVADTFNNATKEILANSGYTTVNTSGFSNRIGVAVDGVAMSSSAIPATGQ
jgi:NHL repeat